MRRRRRRKHRDDDDERRKERRGRCTTSRSSSSLVQVRRGDQHGEELHVDRHLRHRGRRRQIGWARSSTPVPSLKPLRRTCGARARRRRAALRIFDACTELWYKMQPHVLNCSHSTRLQLDCCLHFDARGRRVQELWYVSSLQDC